MNRKRGKAAICGSSEVFDPQGAFRDIAGMVGDGGSFAGDWIPPNLVAAFCVTIKNESVASEFPDNLFVQARLVLLFSLKEEALSCL